ncbi:hypothetical protein [Paenibacillus tyrfis]|uniref:hypothetical protein n=1 Tax=Paenibacillus tyrfis TaxID=1501230 RepID=UPI00209F3C62|nr:hypothetical protein [Paenibacillus tyrfis]MCP1308254.1 hypothetical protein [Paenibacillus tyrfis]
MACGCGCSAQKGKVKAAKRGTGQSGSCPCKVNNAGLRFRSKKGNLLTFEVVFNSKCTPCTSSPLITFSIPKVFRGKARIVKVDQVFVTVDATPLADFVLAAKVQNRCIRPLSERKCVFKVVSSCSQTRKLRIINGKRIDGFCLT